eukprot:1363074-Pyramimonas_sp.AAC.1
MQARTEQEGQDRNTGAAHTSPTLPFSLQPGKARFLTPPPIATLEDETHTGGPGRRGRGYKGKGGKEPGRRQRRREGGSGGAKEEGGQR